MVNVSLNAHYLATDFGGDLRDKFFRPVTNVSRQNRPSVLGTPYQVIRERVLRVSAALSLQSHLLTPYRYAGLSGTFAVNGLNYFSGGRFLPGINAGVSALVMGGFG